MTYHISAFVSERTRWRSEMVWGDGEEMKGKRRKRNSESDLFKGLQRSPDLVVRTLILAKIQIYYLYAASERAETSGGDTEATEASENTSKQHRDEEGRGVGGLSAALLCCVSSQTLESLH